MNPKFKLRLVECFTERQVEQIESLFDGVIQPEDFEPVAAWSASCYHKPKRNDLMMAAFNVVLEGHGVEAIFGEDVRWPDMEYVNMGDTYNVTIVHDFLTASFKVMSWGDWVEAAEREGRSYA